MEFVKKGIDVRMNRLLSREREWGIASYPSLSNHQILPPPIFHNASNKTWEFTVGKARYEAKWETHLEKYFESRMGLNPRPSEDAQAN